MNPENLYLENLYLKRQIIQLQSQLMQMEFEKLEREIAAAVNQQKETKNVPDSIQS